MQYTRIMPYLVLSSSTAAAQYEAIDIEQEVLYCAVQLLVSQGIISPKSHATKRQILYHPSFGKENLARM